MRRSNQERIRKKQGKRQAQSGRRYQKPVHHRKETRDGRKSEGKERSEPERRQNQGTNRRLAERPASTRVSPKARKKHCIGQCFRPASVHELTFSCTSVPERPSVMLALSSHHAVRLIALSVNRSLSRSPLFLHAQDVTRQQIPFRACTKQTYLSGGTPNHAPDAAL